MKSTSYYVQISVNGGHPQNLYYSKDGYRFMDNKSAQNFLNKEKKSDPKQKYRIIKLVENVSFTDWE